MLQNNENEIADPMKMQKITALQSQIEMVKERLARNKRTLLDNKGVTERVANMEYKKINSSDPSMIWRWNVGQQDMKEANERVKQGSANKYGNEVEAILKDSISPEYAEQVQLLDQVRSKIAEGKTLGLDVSLLEEREREIAKKVNTSRGNIDTVKAVRIELKNLNSRLKYNNITPAKYNEAIENLLNEDFDDAELRLELQSSLLSGKKKVTDNKNAQAVRERDKPILDKINNYRKEKLNRGKLDKLPANWKDYEKMPNWPYGPL